MLAQAYFGKKVYFGRKPILGGNYISGTGLFLERNIYFWITCHRWQKISREENEGKEACRWRKSSVVWMHTNLAMLGL
jgi:hypothetical protein